MMAHFDRENTIQHLDDDVRFEQDSDDVFIIETIANDNPKPIWITADIAQKRILVERAALAESGMNVGFFKRFQKGMTFHDQALRILTVWPSIVELCSRVRVPTAFEISSGSTRKVDLLGPTSSLFK